MNTTAENRRHTRVPLNWPVVLLASQGPVKGETGNISIEGALILSQETPELDEAFEAILKSSETQEISVTCEKVWSSTFNTNGSLLSGMGVRFKKMSLADQDLIATQVSEYLL